MGTKTRSNPARGRSRRKLSRRSRLARFRATAPPMRREAASPSREYSRPFSRATRVKSRPSSRRPRRKTRRKSPAVPTRSRGRSPARDGRGPTAQAAIRFRPFWRRLFRTRRPPLVLIRTRNPWVLFRFRLFGWNVRFIVLFRPQSRSAPAEPRLPRPKAQVYPAPCFAVNPNDPRRASFLVSCDGRVIALARFGGGLSPAFLAPDQAAFPQVLKSLCKTPIGPPGVVPSPCRLP